MKRHPFYRWLGPTSWVILFAWGASLAFVFVLAASR